MSSPGGHWPIVCFFAQSHGSHCQWCTAHLLIWLPALRRLNIHPGDARCILTAARKALPRHNFVPLQQKLIPYVARHTAIHVPYMLALPLPTQSHHLCRRVSKAFRLFLKETRLPRVVQEYLASMLRVVPNPVCKLGSTLVPATIDLSISNNIATLRDIPCCGCGDTASKAHHCQRQLLFFPDELRERFGESHARILTTSANAYTRPARDLVHTRAPHNLQALCKQIPKSRPSPFTNFAATVHRYLAHDSHCGEQDDVLSTGDVRGFRQEFPCHRAVTLDKNGLCYVVVCYVFWLRVILKAYNDRPEHCHHYTATSAADIEAVMVIYSYILSRVLPLFQKVQPPAAMRTKLNQCLPWLRGLRLPPLHLTPPGACSADLYDAFPSDAFPQAVAWYNDLSERAKTRGQGSPDALHVPCAAKRKWRIPSTTSTFKQKSVGAGTPTAPRTVEQVATRETFQHAGHPLAPTLKQGGRIAQLMERAYTLSFMTIKS